MTNIITNRYKCIKNIIFAGEANLDSPDSPMADEELRTDPSILDREDPLDHDGHCGPGRGTTHDLARETGTCSFLSSEQRAPDKGRFSASSFGNSSSSAVNGFHSLQ
jgi:hypothetical protein